MVLARKFFMVPPMHTAGGLVKSDLVQDKYGSIKSQGCRRGRQEAYEAGGRPMVKVFKPRQEG